MEELVENAEITDLFHTIVKPPMSLLQVLPIQAASPIGRCNGSLSRSRQNMDFATGFN
jgi:hypothetical protein